MNAWRFITLVLAALAIGAPLAHVLEMPVRRTYDPALYVTVTHTLYRYFGIVGAMIEVGAVVGAVVWAAGLGRSRTSAVSAHRWVVAGAACLVLAHVLFWLLVNPVNQAFAAWTPTAVPPGLDPVPRPVGVHPCRPRGTLPAWLLRSPGVGVHGSAHTRRGTSGRNYRVGASGRRDPARPGAGISGFGPQ
jgi:hypothetical protein